MIPTGIKFTMLYLSVTLFDAAQNAEGISPHLRIVLVTRDRDSIKFKHLLFGRCAAASKTHSQAELQ